MRIVTITLGVLAAHGLAAADEMRSETARVTHESAETGGFLPLSDTPAIKASRTKVFGVYEGDTPRGVATVEAWLTEQFQAQARVQYDDTELAPAFQGQLGLLQEYEHGLDFQVSAGWDRRGLAKTSALLATAGVGRTLAGTYAMATSRFDFGLDGDEVNGSFGIAAIRNVAPRFYAGFDTQLEVDFEPDDMEPAGESDWVLRAAPVATYAVDNYTLTTSAGIVADKAHDAPRDVGLFVSVGVGTAL